MDAPLRPRTRLSDEDVYSVVGAFWAPDLDLFRVLLDETASRGPGDLAELGVLVGRSAVLIGDSLGPEETFTVVDLFEDPAADDANTAENRDSYHGISQRRFEENYLRFHDGLPVIVRGLSDTVLEHASRGSHRFVHVDASHLYDHVAQDIISSQALLRPDGVLVLDDYRAEHTPGVAAATWQAVRLRDLHPIAVSPHKMYATWGDPEPHQAAVRRWLDVTDIFSEVQSVNGAPLLRVGTPTPPGPHPLKRYVPEIGWPALTWARGLPERLRERSGKGDDRPQRRRTPASGQSTSSW